MVRKQSLRTFLRSEVVKHRIQPPSPPKRGKLGLRSEEHSQSQTVEVGTIISDTDSLFGDPILSAEEIAEKRLQDFLSQESSAQSSAQSSVSPNSPSVRVHPHLQSLKSELKDLVSAVEDAGPREKELIRRQRAALVEEIGRLEGGIKVVLSNEYKGMLLALRYP
jgi:hypothetical protein